MYLKKIDFLVSSEKQQDDCKIMDEKQNVDKIGRVFDDWRIFIVFPVDDFVRVKDPVNSSDEECKEVDPGTVEVDLRNLRSRRPPKEIERGEREDEESHSNRDDLSFAADITIVVQRRRWFWEHFRNNEEEDGRHIREELS